MGRYEDGAAVGDGAGDVASTHRVGEGNSLPGVDRCGARGPAS
jgi:hypothetical protein